MSGHTGATRLHRTIRWSQETPFDGPASVFDALQVRAFTVPGGHGQQP
jgi:hypothetical protein